MEFASRSKQRTQAVISILMACLRTVKTRCMSFIHVLLVKKESVAKRLWWSHVVFVSPHSLVDSLSRKFETTKQLSLILEPSSVMIPLPVVLL